MGILYIFIIMLMRVLQSLFSKKTALVMPDGVKPYISYMVLSNLFSALFAFAVIIPTLNFAGVNMQAIMIASVSGICLALSSLFTIKALMGGTIALSSIFATAGMIIPVIFGAILFNETLSIVQALAIIVLFFSICLIINSEKNTFKNFSIKTLWYLLGTLVTNGIVMFCQKLFGELQPDGNVSMFSLLTFLIPAIVLGVVSVILNMKSTGQDNTAKFPKSLVIYTAILSFAVFIIQQFVTLLTPIMSAAVLFTLVNGGATVIGAIVGAVAYKEKITAKSGMGIILAICALVFIKIFE